jgi:IS605 OrfB family transposase
MNQGVDSVNGGPLQLLFSSLSAPRTRKRLLPIWKDCKGFPGGTAGRRKVATTGANRPCGWPRLHARVSQVLQAWLHQTTARLVREFSVMGIEDLNVRGMMANQKLARNIADIGFHEFRRQLEYKTQAYGAEVVRASRWFPSSKMCSACGRIWEELPLSIREWTCECGTFHARDSNAARNLRRYALNRASCARINACGEEGSGSGLTPNVKPASLKQELTMSYLGMDRATVAAGNSVR